MDVKTQSPLRASNMQRVWACPPAVWREREMPELETSEAAEDGTYLHAAVVRAFTKGDLSGLNDEQRGVVKSCLDFLKRFTSLLPEDKVNELVRQEVTLPLLDSDGAKIIDREITADVLIFGAEDGTAIVIDWKTGRGVPLHDAAKDLQLLCYALAARNNFDDIHQVIVYRFHPRLWDSDRMTSIAYSGDDAYWRRWEGVLKDIVAKSRPDAPAVPGESQCLYCKAKLTCKEFRAWAEPRPEELPAAVNAALTPAALGRVLDYKKRLKLLNAVMADAEELARKALLQGVPIVSPDGTRWGLKDGRNVREIEDVAAAAEALAPYMPVEAVLSACKFRLEPLETAFKAATGMKGKAAKETMESALGGLMTHKQQAPTLVELKD